MTSRSIYRALSDATDALENAEYMLGIAVRKGNAEQAHYWRQRIMFWTSRIAEHQRTIDGGRRLERAVEAEGESV